MPGDTILLERHTDHLDEIKAFVDAGAICVGVNVVITADELTQDDATIAALIDDKIKQSEAALRASLATIVDAQVLRSSNALRASLRASLAAK